MSLPYDDDDDDDALPYRVSPREAQNQLLLLNLPAVGSPAMADLCDNMKWLRGFHGLTQAQLAKRAAVSLRTMVDIEQGKRKLTVYRLRMLAQAFRLTPELLLSFHRHPDWRAKNNYTAMVGTVEEFLKCVICRAPAVRGKCWARCRVGVLPEVKPPPRVRTFGLLPGEES